MTQFEHYDDGEIGPPPPALLTRGEFGAVAVFLIAIVACCAIGYVIFG